MVDSTSLDNMEVKQESLPTPPIQPYIPSTPASPAALPSESPYPAGPSFSPVPTPISTPLSQPLLTTSSPRGHKRKLSPTPSNVSARGSPAANGTASTPTKDEDVGVVRGPDSENAVARMGVKVPGSVDKVASGEECWSWSEIPLNKQGFRYIPCAPSPSISPTPIFPFYRSIPTEPIAHPIHLDWLDRSAFLKLSESALTCTTEKGYRSVRGNVGVKDGSWYFEAIVERGIDAPREGNIDQDRKGMDGPHVRVGWGRREASVNGPVGFEGYSYGLRDLTGEKVHLSRPRSYGLPFGTGDVVGCLIRLPKRPEPIEGDPMDPARIKRKRVAIRYKGQLYFESVDYAGTKDMEDFVGRDVKPVGATTAKEGEIVIDEKKKEATGKPGKGKKRRKDAPQEDEQPVVVKEFPRLEGSSISFFLNGQPMASTPAYTDLFSYLPHRQLQSSERKSNKRAYTAEAAHKDRENHFDDGTLGYYPLISVFGGGKVRFNPGPDWEAPVQFAGTAPRPLSERWEEFREEERQWDENDEQEFLQRWEKEMKAEKANGRKSDIENKLPRSSKPKSTKATNRKTANKLSMAAMTNSHAANSTPDLDRTTPSARSTPAPSTIAVQGYGAYGGESPAPSDRESSVPLLATRPPSGTCPRVASDTPVPQEEDPLAGWDPALLASLSRSQIRQLMDQAKQEKSPSKKEIKSSPIAMSLPAPNGVEDSLHSAPSEDLEAPTDAPSASAVEDMEMPDVKPIVPELEIVRDTALETVPTTEMPDVPMMAESDEDASGEDDVNDE